MLSCEPNQTEPSIAIGFVVSLSSCVRSFLKHISGYRAFVMLRWVNIQTTKSAKYTQCKDNREKINEWARDKGRMSKRTLKNDTKNKDIMEKVTHNRERNIERHAQSAIHVCNKINVIALPCVCMCFVCSTVFRIYLRHANIKPFFTVNHRQQTMKRNVVCVNASTEHMNIIQTYHRRKFYFRPSDQTSKHTHTHSQSKLYRSMQKWCVSVYAINTIKRIMCTFKH